MIVDRYDIDPMGVLGVMWRREDGLSHRELYAPGADVSGLPKELQAVVAAAWTPDVLEAWRASIVSAPTVETKADLRDERFAAIEERLAKLEVEAVDMLRAKL